MSVRLRSLRVRLMLATAVAILLALTVSGILLTRLFVQHVEDRVATELQRQLNQLVAGLEADDNGIVRSANGLADHRFSEPYSGLYWQIDVDRGPRQRSRSLWDFELQLPADDPPGTALRRHDITGPRNGRLFAVARTLARSVGAENVTLRTIVAVDRKEIDDAASQFRSALWRSLIIVGGALFTAFALTLHVGLLPLQRLRTSLENVHSGKSASVEGDFPTEVRSLVDGMNRLLEQQRRSLARAREQAGDLAHGFKTPLSLLAATARELRRGGMASSAQDIDAQIETMGRHVRRELARARVAGNTGVDHGGVAVKPVAERIVNTMRRIHSDRDLSWSIDGHAGIRFAGDETDLMEIIGNLAENAGKWAASRVQVSIRQTDGVLDLCVDDDGPGIAPGAESAALERGKRLDETTEGSGLGLSIVAKAVAAYGGEIDLSRSPLGGLRAHVTLPAVTEATFVET